MHLVRIASKVVAHGMDGFFSWTTPLNPRSCHAGRSQDKATQVKVKVRGFI